MRFPMNRSTAGWRGIEPLESRRLLSASLVPEGGQVTGLPNGTATGTVTITNTGDQTAPKGKSQITIYSSPDGSTADAYLTRLSTSLHLAPGASKTLHFHLSRNEQQEAGGDGNVLIEVTDPAGNAQSLGITDAGTPANNGGGGGAGNWIRQLENNLDEGLEGSTTFTTGSNAGQEGDMEIDIDAVGSSGAISGDFAGFIWGSTPLIGAKVTASGKFSARVRTSVFTAASISGQFSLDQSTGAINLNGTFKDGSNGSGTYSISDD